MNEKKNADMLEVLVDKTSGIITVTQDDAKLFLTVDDVHYLIEEFKKSTLTLMENL